MDGKSATVKAVAHRAGGCNAFLEFTAVGTHERGLMLLTLGAQLLWLVDIFLLLALVRSIASRFQDLGLRSSADRCQGLNFAVTALVILGVAVMALSANGRSDKMARFLNDGLATLETTTMLVVALWLLSIAIGGTVVPIWTMVLMSRAGAAVAKGIRPVSKTVFELPAGAPSQGRAPMFVPPEE